MPDHDPALSRLLAGRDTLSRPEREEIFDAVWSGLDADAPQESARTGRSWFGVVLAFGAAAMAFAAVGLEPPTHDSGAVGVRGAATGPVVAPRCDGGGSCTTGDQIHFEIAGATQWSHIGLFARRPDGTVIWYSPPNEDVGTDVFEPQVETTLAPRTVDVDEQHTAGRYELTAIFSRRPLSREEIRRRLSVAHPGDEVAVTEAEFYVR
jgi:hypothetical protein